MLIVIVAGLTVDLVVIEPGGRSASLIDAVSLLYYLLLIASGEVYSRRPVAATTVTSATNRARLQPVSPLPYAAVASTYALLLMTVLRPWTDPVSGIAIGAVLITALVVARQLLAVRQNVRLLSEIATRQNEERFRSLVQHSSYVILVISRVTMIQF